MNLNAFNPYIWNIYKHSFEGNLVLQFLSASRQDKFSSILLGSLASVEDFLLENEDTETLESAEFLSNSLSPTQLKNIESITNIVKNMPCASLEEMREILRKIVENVKFYEEDINPEKWDGSKLIYSLPLISRALNLCFPDYFFPYCFQGKFYAFRDICQFFKIDMPKIPPKPNLVDRFLYYAEASWRIMEFARNNNLNNDEILAFLYDFSLNVIYSSNEEDELPQPRNAWLLMGGVDNGDLDKLDSSRYEDEFNWQGNLDMRRGDVCLMYITSPKKSLHSIWRVIEDAYEDPFFHYKQTVQIGYQEKIPNLKFSQLATDPLLAQNNYIKAHLQGASGKALTQAEYHRILELLRQQGEISEDIPLFPKQEVVDLSELSNERDVELRLVEPLLRRAGVEDKEWQRQLLVQMGHKERVFPDYAIGLTGKAPEYRVKVLIEVKYRAAGERAWHKAFLQVKSYGLRLGAKVILTAAAEGVRVYERKNDDFDFTQGIELKWSELQEGEKLRWLSRLLKS